MFTEEDLREFGFMDKYVILRAKYGVYAGILSRREGKEFLLETTRRIWFWDGAASLSQLALDGTSKPENCKFPAETDRMVVSGVIETIPCTDKARKSIQAVPNWEA